MNEPLQIALAETAGFLEREGIAYALIGALAVSLRGQPRATADVDMVIAADVPRALTLIATLPGSEFEPLFQGVEEVVETAFILPLRHRRTKIKIDLALGLSGFEKQAVSRADPISVAGRLVAVARVEDLLIMKAIAGRPQDDQDLRSLVIAQGSCLDWNYCLQVATDLGTTLGLDIVGRIHDLRSGGDLDR